MRSTEDWLKIAIFIIIVIFFGGFLFRFLFKIGILAVIALGVVYLYKKVVEK